MKPFLNVFHQKIGKTPPLWLMRQAGRYLPEYRAIRASAPSFLDFCYDVEKSVEATLQPINRFSFDAAIIFSDILVIPDALGQRVRFAEGEGPRLEPIETRSDLSRLAFEIDIIKLEPVYDAIREVRRRLAPEKALIGFCGAPWTLATYMVAGRGTPDQAPARFFAYSDPDAFSKLITKLEKCCITHLEKQIEAGADVVQIFDSWAGILPEHEFETWCVAPVRRIVTHLKQRHPDVPVIGFPRAIAGRVDRFALETNVDAIGLDTAARLSEARQSLPPSIVTQGNLDPLALVLGGQTLDSAVRRIIEATENTLHIFNLGHGILPSTPIEHVEQLVRLVRG